MPCPLLRHASSSLQIMTLLNAVKRLQGQVKRTRHPVDSIVLSKICEVLDSGYVLPYMDCLLHAACVTALLWGINT